MLFVLEKKLPLIISLFITVIIGYMNFAHRTNIRLRYDILSASISLSSIFTGFLITTITLIFAMNETSIIRGFKEGGVYKQLTAYLIHAINSSFFSALLSLVGLFIEIKEKEPPQLLESLFLMPWILTTSLAIASYFRIIICLSKIIEHIK